MEQSEPATARGMGLVRFVTSRAAIEVDNPVPPPAPERVAKTRVQNAALTPTGQEERGGGEAIFDAIALVLFCFR